MIPTVQSDEEALVSCMMHAPRETGSACIEAGLEPAWLFHAPARTMLTLLMECWQNGRPMDLISLTNLLRERQLLDVCGGAEGITEIYTGFVIPGMVGEYIARIREMFIRRELAAKCEEYQSRAADLPEDAQELVMEAGQAIAAIGQRRAVSKASAREHMMELFDELSGEGNKDAVFSGLENLDELTGGWQPGNLVVICAEAKGGKSALMLNILEQNCVRSGRCAALFSLEMSGKENIARLLCGLAKVNGMDLRRRKLNSEQFADITRWQDRVAGTHLDIITDARTLPELQARAIMLNARRKLDIVCLDYIQLLGGATKEGDNREREVASVSRGMKALAERLGCVVIALSQLNDKGLLRESRAIGQDANCIIGIDKIENEPGVKFLRIVAQRSGPSGDAVPVAWLPQFCQFKNLDQTHKLWKSTKGQ